MHSASSKTNDDFFSSSYKFYSHPSSHFNQKFSSLYLFDFLLISSSLYIFFHFLSLFSIFLHFPLVFFSFHTSTNFYFFSSSFIYLSFFFLFYFWCKWNDFPTIWLINSGIKDQDVFKFWQRQQWRRSRLE